MACLRRCDRVIAARHSIAALGSSAERTNRGMTDFAVTLAVRGFWLNGRNGSEVPVQRLLI
jgi:hypothetical protein